MKQERKTFELWMEFATLEELEGSLLKALREVRGGIKYNREMYRSAICEWKVKGEKDNDYREEKINGKWCQVYPSKMNQPRKLKARKHGK